jgi:hypothetical protein
MQRSGTSCWEPLELFVLEPPMESIDFSREADLAAVNEACLPEDAMGCSLDNMCACCKALSNAIRNRLQAAYKAGFAAASPIPNRIE